MNEKHTTIMLRNIKTKIEEGALNSCQSER